MKRFFSALTFLIFISHQAQCQLDILSSWSDVEFTITTEPDYTLENHERIVIGNIYMMEGDSIDMSTDIINTFSNVLTTQDRPAMYDRNNLEDILDEMEFQKSGLVDQATITKIGKFLSAGVILVGKVVQHQSSYEVRKKNAPSINLIDIFESAPCKEPYVGSLTYRLVVNVKLIDIETAQIIFSDNIDGTYVDEIVNCSKPIEPEPTSVYPKALNQLANAFEKKFYSQVKDIQANFQTHKQFNDELRKALAYLKIGDEAQALTQLEEISEQKKLKDSAKSSALYNLGLLKYHMGETEACKAYMKEAFILNDRCKDCLAYIE